MKKAPIGVFDSGVGGLTVARAIIDQLPRESVLYIGDTAHTPYGPRPIAQVRELALNVMDTLVDSGVKALVIACNSATAAVLPDARERYEVAKGVPVIEVISPAVRRAVAATTNGKIGVIGTRATIESGAYRDAFAAGVGLDLTMQACPRFVELVEAGVTSGQEALEVARTYLEPIKAAGVDTLVLGCTHYPLLTGVISYVMGPEVTLVSSAEETAKELFAVLTERDLAYDDAAPTASFASTGGSAPTGAQPADAGEYRPQHRFYATGQTEQFQQLAQRFLGPEVQRVDDASTMGHSS